MLDISAVKSGHNSENPWDPTCSSKLTTAHSAGRFYESCPGVFRVLSHEENPSKVFMEAIFHEASKIFSAVKISKLTFGPKIFCYVISVGGTLPNTCTIQK